MDREKQIKAMRNTLIQISKQPIMIEGLEHWSDTIAEELCEAGYRKASDVAEEIFDKIQRRFKELYEEGKMAPFQCYVKAINETEKKYTEDKK